MKDILVIIDGFSDPMPEIRLAVRVSNALGGDLTLATSLPVKPDQTTRAGNLEAILDQEEHADRRFSRVTLQGNWSDSIITEALTGKYALIILSIELAKLHEKLLSQTVLNRVSSQSQCPVMVAKNGDREFNRILICDSGFDTEPILERVTSSLPEFVVPKVDITVLHVMSQITAYPGVRGSQLRADAEELIVEHTPEGLVLEHDMAILDRAKTRPRPKIRHGFVVEEIIKETQEQEYDLMVIGSHRGEGWQRYLLQDIAGEIVNQVELPVLLVP